MVYTTKFRSLITFLTEPFDDALVQNKLMLVSSTVSSYFSWVVHLQNPKKTVILLANIGAVQSLILTQDGLGIYPIHFLA